MGFPVGSKGIQQSSHHVETSKVNLTVLLASVNFLLNPEILILTPPPPKKIEKNTEC